MIYRHKNHIQWVGVLVALSIFFATGCAVTKPLWGDPESGLILTYRLAEGKVVQYQNTDAMVQELNIMGQLMKTETKTDMDFSATSKGKDAENLVLGITVDRFRIDVDGPQGNRSPDTGAITGKGFDMTLSPMGRELDLSGATALTYQTGPLTKGSVKPMFDTIFPDLPAQPVKIGDTWTSIDDTASDNGNTKLHTVMENVDVLEGFETVDGLECVKITRKMSGTVTGEGNQMGTDFTLKGEIKGTATWYFAYKEGILARLTMKSSANIDVDSAMGMKIPMTQESKSEIKLIQ